MYTVKANVFLTRLLNYDGFKANVFLTRLLDILNYDGWR